MAKLSLGVWSKNNPDYTPERVWQWGGRRELEGQNATLRTNATCNRMFASVKKTSLKKRVTRFTKQTSGQLTVITHTQSHTFLNTQSCSGHYLSLVIMNTHIHTQPYPRPHVKKIKSALKDKSAQIGANTSATMALWNTYNVPKHSASSSMLNSALTNHLQKNWPTKKKKKIMTISPQTFPEMFTGNSKKKKNENA